MSRTFRVLSTPAPMTATYEMTATNWWDHIAARIGIRRGEHRVAPGIFRLGNPNADSPVFVSANYSLSFDALRTSLRGFDGYILVLDTHGVNVWCAAGKGTFGTKELVHRIQSVKLDQIVNHRKLILPQLGAPGVAAHEVRKLTGFTVEYGPVRAADLPEFLKTHQATPEMRRVRFPLQDRLVLTFVDMTQTLLPALVALGISYLIGGLTYFLAAFVIFLCGLFLFPALLPWLPTRDFSSKGAILGFIAALPFAAWVILGHPEWSWYRQLGQTVGFLLVMSSSISFISLNFTGSTTFTSRTGVRKEIFTYFRPMAATFILGLVSLIVFAFVK